MHSTRRLSRIHGLILLVPVLGLVAALLFGGKFALLGGPFAGAIARDWQSCCAETSFSLAYWALGVIALGGAVQFLVRPGAKNRLRYSIWALSFAPWIAATWPSLKHAIS